MQFPAPLRRGRLVQRYKRFFADVELEDGTVVTAHCPNPGAMLGLNMPGMPAWVSPAAGAARKLAWTLELVEAEDGLVGVNTMRPNQLADEALTNGLIPELAGYASRRREAAYGAASRIDFLLEGGPGPRCWVEVKSVTLSRDPGLAEWPDCVSKRASTQLRELVGLVENGERAVILFLVQRACSRFATAADLDPAYASGLLKAAETGVEVLCYRCEVSPQGVRVTDQVPWRDRPG
ncbi:MAG TPA: DNA/RNA nuclease SfsA [Caulobacteraceae bacterium]|jgi:sugar fermentation stimulation protein A